MDSYEGSFKVYKISEYERHWFIAENMADAVRLYTNTYANPEDEPITVELVEPHTEITVTADWPEWPEEGKVQTAAEWAAGITKADILCSTVY